MKKESQRVAISKRLLKETLLQVLENKDISKVSITELCQKSEINRTTFYQHYNAPQDILLDIESDIIEKIKNLAPLLTSAKDVKAYLVEICSYLYSNAAIVRTLIRTNSDANLVRLINNIYMSVSYKEAVDNETALDDDSMKLIAASFAGGGYYLIRSWLMEDIQKKPSEIADLIYRLLIRNTDL